MLFRKTILRVCLDIFFYDIFYIPILIWYTGMVKHAGSLTKAWADVQRQCYTMYFSYISYYFFHQLFIYTAIKRHLRGVV